MTIRISYLVARMTANILRKWNTAMFVQKAR